MRASWLTPFSSFCEFGLPVLRCSDAASFCVASRSRELNKGLVAGEGWRGLEKEKSLDIGLKHPQRDQLRQRLDRWPKGLPIVLEASFGWG
jgi:hypothetical protein